MKFRSILFALLCVGLIFSGTAQAAPHPRESDAQIRHIVENRASEGPWVFVGPVELSWSRNIVVAHVGRYLPTGRRQQQSCTWTAMFDPGKSLVPQQWECRNGSTSPVASPPRTLLRISPCDNGWTSHCEATIVARSTRLNDTYTEHGSCSRF
jgi:hypothetical protein